MLFICYQVLDMVVNFGERMIYSVQNKTFNIEQKGAPLGGVFFSVLLTMEIIQTIRVFSNAHTVKLKIILIVSLIAVTRKILMLDIDDTGPMAELALAALIIALSAGYFLVSKSESRNGAEQTRFQKDQ